MLTPTLFEPSKLKPSQKLSSKYSLSSAIRAAMLGSVFLLSGVSTGAIAAPSDNSRTLPVRSIDALPDISSLSGVKIDENRSRSVDPSLPSASEAKSANTDRMGQLIENKSQIQPATPPVTSAPAQNQINNQSITLTPSTTPSLNPDNMSAAELTRQDEISDSTDDIEEGQAVASPTGSDDALSNNSPLPYNQPTTEQRQLATDDTAIKSIENKNGKTYTTLDLSSYAQQVNNARWTPNMKVNSAMTIKMQALLDWNHASPGPVDGGWGMNSKKALINFQNMHGLPATGKMNQQTWDALNKNIPKNQPVLVTYTLTDEDVNTKFAATPSGSEAKSKMKGLYYQDIKEMLGERFHMDVRYLDKLNKGKSYKSGETITVLNTGAPLKARITRVVANKADKTLYAYSGEQLVATYPTTVGSSSTPSPHGSYKIVNKVKMPWYKATVGEDNNKQVYMLPPGPNNPVGVVWMGLSKPSYGLHGSPKPEGISRQASHGCIRLTNWDVLEVYANIENGATVELK